MAIKPGDCVIKIEDMVIGTKRAIDSWNGREIQITEYEKYWENFNSHVHEVANKIDASHWTNWKQSPSQLVYEQELKKFGAVHKETKNFSDRYIKFKSHKHLTMFVLRWT